MASQGLYIENYVPVVSQARGIYTKYSSSTILKSSGPITNSVFAPNGVGVTINTTSYTSVDVNSVGIAPLNIIENQNTYGGLNVNNINSGTSASTDISLYPDNGDLINKYLDLGMASSTYNVPIYSIQTPNTGYLVVVGGNLTMGTGTAGRDFLFHTGGTLTANEFMRIVDGTPQKLRLGMDTVATLYRSAASTIKTDGNFVATLGLTSISPTSGVGYATGSGGTITQATSKSTGVTLNTATGAVTMNAASLAATTSVGFTLTNSAIAATDVVVVNIKSGATVDSYTVTVDTVATGSARISLRNVTAGALAEAVVLNFAVIKGVTS